MVTLFIYHDHIMLNHFHPSSILLQVIIIFIFNSLPALDSLSLSSSIFACSLPINIIISASNCYLSSLNISMEIKSWSKNFFFPSFDPKIWILSSLCPLFIFHLFSSFHSFSLLLFIFTCFYLQCHEKKTGHDMKIHFKTLNKRRTRKKKMKKQIYINIYISIYLS